MNQHIGVDEFDGNQVGLLQRIRFSPHPSLFPGMCPSEGFVPTIGFSKRVQRCRGLPADNVQLRYTLHTIFAASDSHNREDEVSELNHRRSPHRRRPLSRIPFNPTPPIQHISFRCKASIFRFSSLYRMLHSVYIIHFRLVPGSKQSSRRLSNAYWLQI